MEQQDIYYDSSEYIETSSGNKVSRTCVLCGSQNIVLNGKTIAQSECVFRGDLANINIGRQCVLGKRVVISPPYKKLLSGGAFYPLQIGDNTIVGNDTIINATVIGHSVYIGKNCVISRAAVLRDCCRIEDNTVVPPETTVPSFTTYKGNPAQYVSDLPSCTQEVMMEATKSFYQHFKPQKK